MPEPTRSPRQSKVAVKARGNLYSHSQSRSQRDVTPVDSMTRQSSLLGAIKNLVTAPLSWLSVTERPLGDNDITQKRKKPFFERSGTPPKPKRVRRSSPDATDDNPAHRKMITPLWDLGNGVPPARHQHNDSQDRTAPSPFVLHERTSQSVEPLDSKLSNIHIRRSITREKSMPPPSPFARSLSRISLTPQPSGATFGPSPKRKRDLTAPPSNSLPLVPAVPTFMRPPSMPPSSLFPQSPTKQASEGPIMSLLAQSRQSLSPSRENSLMLIGSDSSYPASPLKVEKTYSTLETFRTPLTRFPSQIYPDHRRPRKVHVPLPSKHFSSDERRKKISLGATPYPTETLGLRKLLQRNKPVINVSDLVEQEIAKTDEGGSVRTLEETANRDPNDTSIKIFTQTLTRSQKLDSYSSLRSPTMKLRRTHISAPQLKKPRNKFSLKEDDIDDEINWGTGDPKTHEPKIPKQHIAFTRRMSEAGMQTEVSTSTDVFLGKPLILPPEFGSSSESKTAAAAVSNLAENSGDHFEERSSSIIESLPRQIFDIVPKIKKNSSLAVDSHMTHITSEVDFSKPSASPGVNNSVTTAQSLTDPPGVPLFFSPAKTEFIPPPLPTNSIFVATPRPSEIHAVPPSENLHARGNAPFSLPKVVAAQEQIVPPQPTKMDSFSLHPTGESLTVPMLPSALVAETQKIPVINRTSAPSKATEAITHNLESTHESTPVVGSSSISFGFDLEATRKPTSQPVIAPSVISPFTFNLPPTSPTSNAGFTFGKPPSEVPSKPPINTLNFGATSSTPMSLNQAEASPIAPVSNLPTGLVGAVTGAETDTHMDINDQMEESPKRVQEKKDDIVSAPGASSLDASMSNSPFSFGGSATKNSTTPFAFGIPGSSPSNSGVFDAGVFSFGDSKATSTGSGFGFSNANPATSGAGFNLFPKPSNTLPNNFAPALATSASAPTFTFGTSVFGPPKVDNDKSVSMVSSAPNSPSIFPQPNVASSPSFSFSIPGSPTFAKLDNANPPNSPSQPFQFGASSSTSSQSGPIFTLGAATSTPPRKLKGLPQRRRK